MTDTNKLKELAERARDKGDWYKASSVDAFPEFHVDQEFMVATSPDVVLWLIAEVERLEAELSQCASALPGTYYMDPPDGGNVSIPEQIRRMAKDAARYRALRQKERGVVVVRNRTSHLFGEHLDAAIDAAIEGAKK
ncbi:hypothetical protein RZC90_006180 [Pseudomonas aeruginosa]|uniref:hypothetical protein n=2 Tax=Pseudomonas aeruginosa TaxID=287 RepID=UPI000690AF35|nr:hypothetical protein [Pseudomonas aeruginosa]ASA30087.1 hypothetical protein CDG41_18475 [Pseudomonas aeruginosa]ASD04143.1 hypothetical protein CD797_17190 [Pseudomonas aeruginosa]ASD04171.1 hypothetical protein CD797_17385 [Pseudomonas aeruginosa]EIU1455988.1 hypothetical protein [Pseudomonas aeruginosa]EIU2824160.1 hypothetical protein [Pseudomonas aeruginosa]